ncbi:ABC transporter ATP-binding protein, partial [Rhizobium ruizarguesonis]
IRNEDGELAQTVELTKNFIIEMEYELREPLTGLSVGLQIMMEDGYSPIISLSDPELDVSRLDTRSPGYYRARVVIPA